MFMVKMRNQGSRMREGGIGELKENVLSTENLVDLNLQVEDMLVI
jgi:hypothetical protein